jgi:hypothetical protein
MWMLPRKFHAILTYILHRSERLASRSGRLSEEPLVLLDKRLGGPKIPSGYDNKRNFLQSVIDPTDILFITSSLMVHSPSSLHELLYSLHFLHHVRWVPSHHGMARSQVADGGDALQVWRAATNILNKQSRTANKG